MALAFKDKSSPESQVGRAHCIHYRRFGETAFVVALDAHEDRFHDDTEQMTVVLNHLMRVVAGLVTAALKVEAPRETKRGGRDKPGHGRWIGDSSRPESALEANQIFSN
jgi:hypothetical protein